MHAYNIFFFACFFFILGILFFQLNFGFWIVILIVLFFGGGIVLRILFKKKLFLNIAFLSFFILAGSFYTSFFNIKLQEKASSILKRNVFDGLVYKNFSGKVKNEYIVKTKDLNFLLEFSFLFPLEEGEKIYFDISKGEIKKAPDYFLKDGIIWQIKNPEILKIEENKSFIGKLLVFKNKIVDYFYSILPREEAALINGLILGERQGFSLEFYEAMKKSGTTHIVALSGYNISVLVFAFLTLFLYLFPRNFSLFFTLVFVILFVLMTGAESSVVRAAIVGVLGMTAKESGRLYDPRNVIILAATLMLILNPNLLLLDLGFILSFFSFIGIVYLKPLLFFKKENNEFQKEGFKKDLCDILKATLAAQIMVFPILLLNFGFFSPFAFLSNVFVLWFVPFLMSLGFFSLFAGLFSNYLSLLSSWILYPFLKTEVFLIEFFGSFDFIWGLKINWIFFVIYYFLLLFLILWRKKFTKVS